MQNKSRRLCLHKIHPLRNLNDSVQFTGEPNRQKSQKIPSVSAQISCNSN